MIPRAGGTMDVQEKTPSLDAIGEAKFSRGNPGSEQEGKENIQKRG